jgi:hypothetical protein
MSNLLRKTNIVLSIKLIKRRSKMKRKQGLKLQVSFKENMRDLEIYNFLLEEIKGEVGISVYIKMLIAEDMKKRNKKELYKESPKTLLINLSTFCT